MVKKMEITIKKESNGIYNYCNVNATDITSSDMEFLNKIVKIATDYTKKSMGNN